MLERSRTAAGRAELVAQNALASLLATISVGDVLQEASTEALLLALRCVRNLCAADAAKEQLLAAGGVQALARLLQAASDAEVPSRGALLATALQALGNACVQCAACQAAVWRCCFPELASRLALLTGPDAALVHPPLCMLLFTCSRHQPCRSKALCEEEGAQLIYLLLSSAASDVDPPDDRSEWLVLLLGELASSARAVKALLHSETLERSYSREQVALVHAVADAIELRQGVKNATERSAAVALAQDTAAMQFFVSRTELACLDAASRVAGAAPALEAWLHLLRAASGEEACCKDADLAAAVTDLTRLLLRMLAALCPPTGPRISRAPDPHHQPPQDASSNFPHHPVYRGYRRDLVAALAVLCQGRREVVEEIVQAGAVLTVVAQCRGDAEDTFVREWAIWAVRSLCELSPEARAEIQALDARTAPTLDADAG